MDNKLKFIIATLVILACVNIFIIPNVGENLPKKLDLQFEITTNGDVNIDDLSLKIHYEDKNLQEQLIYRDFIHSNLYIKHSKSVELLGKGNLIVECNDESTILLELNNKTPDDIGILFMIVENDINDYIDIIVSSDNKLINSTRIYL
ncbi:MAG: hypothetical protein GXZ08_02005 [Tissierellia bacterium]|nr:hypothetical protein [Tissierellia bacterium]